MADEVSLWPSENVPDDDLLYMRVHKDHFCDGEIAPGAFRNQPTRQHGMSTDWEKYSSPEETRNRARNPIANAVIQMKVGHVRRIPHQRVAHTPDRITLNRALTDVFGDKNPEVRLKFLRIFQLVIPLNAHPQ